MRIVFMGTPNFAATILEDLSQHYNVVAAYTRPDAVRGRGKKLVASPVKETAMSLGIPVEQPTTFKDPEAIATLEQYRPDFIIVAAYGMILPVDVLECPTYHCLNVHASLLPRWRGAAPIEHAILADDEELCESCKRHRFLFKRSIALVGYDDVAARSISRIKYTGAREFLDYYGREAVRRRGEELRRMQIDAIVPVPVHPSRKRKRGYNQATVLAEVMGAELGLPVYEAALYRRKKTAASKELNAAERLKNLMSAFYAGPIPQDLRRVLLVDDIFTTGATMESCTRTLLAAGVEEVYCFALAIRSER